MSAAADGSDICIIKAMARGCDTASRASGRFSTVSFSIQSEQRPDVGVVVSKTEATIKVLPPPVADDGDGDGCTCFTGSTSLTCTIRPLPSARWPMGFGDMSRRLKAGWPGWRTS